MLLITYNYTVNQFKFMVKLLALFLKDLKQVLNVEDHSNIPMDTNLNCLLAASLKIFIQIANVRPSENEIEGNELITSASTTTTTQKTTTSSLAGRQLQIHISQFDFYISDQI